MIAVKVTHDLAKLGKRLHSIQSKQIPFATAKALTATAKHVQAKQPEQLEKDFDNPTPFTKRGFYVRGATKAKQYAIVGIKDIQAKYLELQIKGGTRRPKGKALIAPSELRRNRYGNIPKGKIKALLAKPSVFSGTVNGTPGVWQRNKNGSMKLLISYSSEQKYKKRYDFVESSRAMARKQFPRELQRSIAFVMRTAK